MGLLVCLDMYIPTIIKIGDHTVEIYKHITKNGKMRLNIVSESSKEDVKIYGPSRVKRGDHKKGLIRLIT